MSEPPICPRCGVKETSAALCHVCGGTIDQETAECEECGWESRKALQEIAAREEGGAVLGPSELIPALAYLSDKVSLLIDNDQLRMRLARMEQRLAEHEARLAMLEKGTKG